MTIPRPEYPRPQMERSEWMNLNGEWQFQFDHGRSGRERGLQNARLLSDTIQVPFCPESSLSGIAHTDFIPAVWYRRSFVIPETWKGKSVLLNFGAVDYFAEIWINGKSAGTHSGGYSSFSFDITELLEDGENSISVYAEDDTRSPLQPTGKQSIWFDSQGCSYTRTTGIWQTVWMEPVSECHLGRPKITTDPENGVAHIEVPLTGCPDGLELTLEAALDGVPVGNAAVRPTGHSFRASIPISDIRPWSPDSPTLYDLKLILQKDGEEVDAVSSYFGLRSLRWDGVALRLNDKPLFQRLILDQGFYPEGIYTAPSDDELRGDIERSQAMGFNGARLHQKVFEERFLYWADRLGYIVWGEMADWGLDRASADSLDPFLIEWREVLERDFSHPSIVGWCPFNETWMGSESRYTKALLCQVYSITKLIDPTRPVIDTSGGHHTGKTDVYDIHDYDQNPSTFKERWDPFANGNQPFELSPGKEVPYDGQPYFISEYGGIWWNPDGKDAKAWGYGDRPKSEEEFIERFKGLTEVLLKHPRMCGFCYTQLTDVEQEVNGLYTYDRRAKFDPEVLRAIVSQKAAIED